MDKNLAELVINTGIEIWPYVFLRSLYVQGVEITEKTVLDHISVDELDSMLDSGWISVGDGGIIELRDGDVWLTDLKPGHRRKTPEKSNFDKQLERVARLAGWPVDFYQKLGEYRTKFKRLLDAHGWDKIETIAYDNQGVGLRDLLNPHIFRSLIEKFEAESDNAF